MANTFSSKTSKAACQFSLDIKPDSLSSITSWKRSMIAFTPKKKPSNSYALKSLRPEKPETSSAFPLTSALLISTVSTRTNQFSMLNRCLTLETLKTVKINTGCPSMYKKKLGWTAKKLFIPFLRMALPLLFARR